ncbi:hypothetical protein ACOSP7_007125 [Xanthoceras sorbifolium]
MRRSQQREKKERAESVQKNRAHREEEEEKEKKKKKRKGKKRKTKRSWGEISVVWEKKNRYGKSKKVLRRRNQSAKFRENQKPVQVHVQTLQGLRRLAGPVRGCCDCFMSI